MVAVIFLVSALILGGAIVRRLAVPLYRFEYPALAIVLGLVSWTWLSFLLALILPYRLSLPLTVGVAGAASLLLWLGTPKATQLALPGRRGARWLWGGFTAATTLILGQLFYSHDLISTPSGIYSAGSTWADYGLHASLINHFAVASHLPLDFPLAAGTHLTYPFLPDLMTAWYVIGGWSLHLAIWLPSLLLAVSFIQLFLGFSLRLIGRVGPAMAGFGMALLAGSTVGLDVALSDWSTSHQSLWSFLGHLPRDYTALDAQNAHVTNIVSDILLPQHAFLFGLPLVATALILIYEGRRHNKAGWIIVAGGILGILPLTHPHSFIALGAVVGVFATVDIVTRRTWRSSYLVALALAGVLALPQIIWQIAANGHGTGGHWSLGWMYDGQGSIITYWWHNFGLVGPWLVLLPAILWWHKPWRHYLIWYMPFWLLFLLANTYSIQPFNYDNLKLIIYVYLIGLLLAGAIGAELLRRHRGLVWAMIPVVVLTITSGSLSIAREFQLHDRFASPDDQALAAWVKHNTATGTIFATTDAPNQPIATLAGRPIVLGYRGWLYNYNLSYWPRQQAIGDALTHDTSGLAAFGAQYLAVSSEEPADWPTNQAWLATLPVDYHNDTWTVYQLAP